MGEGRGEGGEPWRAQSRTAEDLRGRYGYSLGATRASNNGQRSYRSQVRRLGVSVEGTGTGCGGRACVRVCVCVCVCVCACVRPGVWSDGWWWAMGDAARNAGGLAVNIGQHGKSTGARLETGTEGERLAGSAPLHLCILLCRPWLDLWRRGCPIHVPCAPTPGALGVCRPGWHPGGQPPPPRRPRARAIRWQTQPVAVSRHGGGGSGVSLLSALGRFCQCGCRGLLVLGTLITTTARRSPRVAPPSFGLSTCLYTVCSEYTVCAAQ